MSLSSIAEYEVAPALEPFLACRRTATILSTDRILTQALSYSLHRLRYTVSPQVHLRVTDSNTALGMDVCLQFHCRTPFQNSP